MSLLVLKIYTEVIMIMGCYILRLNILPPQNNTSGMSGSILHDGVAVNDPLRLYMTDGDGSKIKV